MASGDGLGDTSPRVHSWNRISSVPPYTLLSMESGRTQIETSDIRFTRPLYTVAHAARIVGMHPATLHTWAHGYTRTFLDRPPVDMGPVIKSLPPTAGGMTIPFIGLVEATVVQAFRSTGLSLQRVRKALDALRGSEELDHALATRSLYTDGAQVLYDFAREDGDPQLRLLTVVGTGQTVYHDVIARYLTRIEFDDDNWATALIVPSTEHEVLRIRPNVANGDPIFIQGGAPLYAVVSRYKAGESMTSIATDYDVPRTDIEEAIRGVYPAAA